MPILTLQRNLDHPGGCRGRFQLCDFHACERRMHFAMQAAEQGVDVVVQQ
ncbi:hypothetical protein [Dyella terrae]